MIDWPVRYGALISVQGFGRLTEGKGAPHTAVPVVSALPR
jgi:hypothetical protein